MAARGSCHQVNQVTVVSVEFEATGSVYRLAWPEAMVAMRVERLHDVRDTTTAEFTVTTTAPGLAPHLHGPVRVNMTSTAARTTLGKFLASRWAEPDWDKLIEQACHLVLRSHREGEPVVEVGESEAEAEPPYRLWPWLVENQPTILFGDGGVFKSGLSNLCGLIVQLPIPDNPLHLRPNYGHVLILDYETDAQEWNRRTRLLKVGLGLDMHLPLQYRRCVQTLADDLTRIQELVAEHRISLLIVDSLAGAVGDDLKENAPVTTFFRALRSLKTTSLLITHVAKDNGDDRRKKPFGSAYFYNWARSVYELRKQQDTDSDTVHLGLYHQKANSGRLQAPIGIQIDFLPDRITVKRQDIADSPDLVTHMRNEDRVTIALRTLAKDNDNARNGATVKEIAEQSQLSEDTIRAVFSAHKDKFVKVGQNNPQKWGLLSRASLT